MSTILDGKKLAEETKKRISSKLSQIDYTPTLAAVLVGDDPASKTYLDLKDRDCSEVGIDFQNYELPSDSSKDEVNSIVGEINDDEEVDGIIVQLPLPDHLNSKEIFELIKSSKDVDGLHPYNVGKLWKSDYQLFEDLVPCTPKGIIRLLDKYNIELEGKRAVIINRSDLVGKPLSKLFMDRNATVTICHSRTENLKSHTTLADVLVTAVGNRPQFAITKDMVTEETIIIDVGMNRTEEGLCGDVKFDEVKPKSAYITPVPGGVGPMTRVTLLENVLIAGGIKLGFGEE